MIIGVALGSCFCYARKVTQCHSQRRVARLVSQPLPSRMGRKTSWGKQHHQPQMIIGVALGSCFCCHTFMQIGGSNNLCISLVSHWSTLVSRWYCIGIASASPRVSVQEKGDRFLAVWTKPAKSTNGLRKPKTTRQAEASVVYLLKRERKLLTCTHASRRS